MFGADWRRIPAHNTKRSIAIDNHWRCKGILTLKLVQLERSFLWLNQSCSRWWPVWPCRPRSASAPSPNSEPDNRKNCQATHLAIQLIKLLWWTSPDRWRRTREVLHASLCSRWGRGRGTVLVPPERFQSQFKLIRMISMVRWAIRLVYRVPDGECHSLAFQVDLFR